MPPHRGAAADGKPHDIDLMEHADGELDERRSAARSRGARQGRGARRARRARARPPRAVGRCGAGRRGSTRCGARSTRRSIARPTPARRPPRAPAAGARIGALVRSLPRPRDHRRRSAPVPSRRSRSCCAVRRATLHDRDERGTIPVDVIARWPIAPPRSNRSTRPAAQAPCSTSKTKMAARR